MEAEENGAARRLYAAAGFRTYGIDRWALKVDGRDVDLALMVLRLDRRRGDAATGPIR